MSLFEDQEINNRAAVLGDPVEHSLSPILHKAGYIALGMRDWDYERIQCTAEDLPRIVGEADESYRGFSVTMPAKFAALEFADEVSERAQLIGSANTLVRTDTGWRADNTDCEGLAIALDELSDTMYSAVLIGAGGTARPALWALAQRGVKEVTLLNRSDRRDELQELVEHLGLSLEYRPLSDAAQCTTKVDVIVSTVPSAALAGKETELAHAEVLDVIYDPWPTPLTVSAAANGYRTVGGHVMLAGQSYSQFEQFTGKVAPRRQMREALEAHVLG